MTCHLAGAKPLSEPKLEYRPQMTLLLRCVSAGIGLEDGLVGD